MDTCHTDLNTREAEPASGAQMDTPANTAENMESESVSKTTTNPAFYQFCHHAVQLLSV